MWAEAASTYIPNEAKEAAMMLSASISYSL